jgi:DNA modification methylase
VDRLITLYSNRGELVYDPFGGLFSVPHQALELGRRGRAAELNPGYFLDGVKYLQAKEKALATPTLFDLMAGEAA